MMGECGPEQPPLKMLKQHSLCLDLRCLSQKAILEWQNSNIFDMERGSYNELLPRPSPSCRGNKHTNSGLRSGCSLKIVGAQ